MEFEKLIAISGQGSLFRIISKANFGLVAESIEDKKRLPVHQSNNVSTLEDISIYTDNGDVPLREVFHKIFQKVGANPALDAKADNDAVKGFFAEILPDYDKERVYISDMRKVVKWYNQLVKADVVKPELFEKNTDASAEQSDVKDEKKKETKKSEAGTKKTAAKAAPKAAAVKNAPAKKVQGVRKAGGS